MWLSSTAQQALHAVVCIAANADRGPVRVDEIAAVIECPRNYLSKTLHLLARAGILRSERGPRGGFRLAKPADKLTLAAIVAPFQPAGARRCLLGRAICGDRNPCAAHGRWSQIQRSVEVFFQRTSVGMLLRDEPRARRQTRAVIGSIRQFNPRFLHGSIAG